MGVSTDAILAWGFNVDAESEEAELLNAFGDERYGELRKLETKHGGALVHHQHSECTAYIVSLKNTVTTAWRGDPKEIVSLDVPKDAQERLDAFAAALGLAPQPGKWLLASYWG